MLTQLKKQLVDCIQLSKGCGLRKDKHYIKQSLLFNPIEDEYSSQELISTCVTRCGHQRINMDQETLFTVLEDQIHPKPWCSGDRLS